MKLKKVLALVLSFVLVLSCVGCSSKTEQATPEAKNEVKNDVKEEAKETAKETKTEAKAETKTEDTAEVKTAEAEAPVASEPEEEPFVIDRSKKAYIDEEGIWRYSSNDEIVDLDGMEIIVADWWTVESEPTTAREIATEEYKEWIEDTYNFKIQNYKWSTYGVWDEDFNDFATSGGDENIVFAMANQWLTTPMRNGLFYDLSTLDCLDFSEDKWDVSTSDKMTLKGAVYGMRVGAAEPRGGVYFNKRLLEDAGINPDSLYQWQANHEWTWAKFEELCAALTRDTDNDGIIDIYAMSSFNGDFMNAICASNGAQIIDIDPATGNFINATNTDEFLEAYDWAHNLRQLYEAPQPEGTDWDYSYDMFKNAQVALIVSEQYKASDFNKNMTDDFGFVVFPMGPKVSDYNGYSTDNAFVIPACYDADRAWDIAFAYNLFTEPTPGYEDDDDWQTPYYTVFRDEKAVDETLAILRDHQEACIYCLVPGVNKDNNYWWNIDAETAAERSETMWDEIQALLDAVNK